MTVRAASRGDCPARREEVIFDGVVIAPPQPTYEGTAGSEGTVNFTVKGASGAEESIVPVLYIDADKDGRLDVDAAGKPAEKFGAGRSTTFVTVSGVDLTPAIALRKFGSQPRSRRSSSMTAPARHCPASRSSSRWRAGERRQLARGRAPDGHRRRRRQGRPDLHRSGRPVDERRRRCRHDHRVLRPGRPSGLGHAVHRQATADWDDAAAQAAAVELKDPAANTTAKIGSVQQVAAKLVDQYGQPLAGK